MDPILLEYAWVLVVLIVLEGLLATDNAVVMAVMVKHLPKPQQKKALFYGLVGAFVFRFTALFMITFLVKFWEIQAIGAAYLLIIAGKNIYDKLTHHQANHPNKKPKKQSGFWMTVVKVELADIAFALDSMLAAVALAVTLPELGTFHIGGINGGQFAVMLLGGMIGLIMIRFAAKQFVVLLEKYPTLETAAFLIVGWVGVKLVVLTLAHPALLIIPESFPHSTLWKSIFWIVLLVLAGGGYLLAVAKHKIKK
ncbi:MULTISPECIES: TerC family protein [unclassified Sporosarcina]|uniref:TerC family protein n=1 Tax=unclassified Sporosarcina TaxID=2647733 RepID=UPI00203E273E|nr:MULTISPECIES: TerC family protein [unclassified Sporosarcina]GKV66026.1 membrane protein [Sporosarcina sp. NCCP-2331]GLB56548.1 membrane protein [Sporosarcina sp. NCCP-2378]